MADANLEAVFDLEEDEESKLDGDADAAFDAGRFVDHDRVAAWVKSWGTQNELPLPRPIRP